jgi:hypothetical protein
MSIKGIKQFISTGQVDEFPQANSAYYFDTERISVNYARLVPSYVYTFVSVNPRGNDEIPSLDEYQTGASKGVKPYFDSRPIFLSLGQEGPMEIVFNLKLIPTALRKWFLINYYKQILPILEKLVDESGNFIELNKRMRMQETGPLYRINRSFIRTISEQSNLNLEFLVDKYTRGEMGNPLGLIDWDQVPKIVTLSYMNDGSIVSKTPISYFLTKFT